MKKNSKFKANFSNPNKNNTQILVESVIFITKRLVLDMIIAANKMLLHLYLFPSFTITKIENISINPIKTLFKYWLSVKVSSVERIAKFMLTALNQSIENMTVFVFKVVLNNKP